MALKVWLPLNGTLKNQGTDNATITDNGSVIDNNGKTGKCYTPAKLTITNIQNLTEENLSICFWAKTTPNSSWQKIVRFDDQNNTQIGAVYFASDNIRIKYEGGYNGSTNVVQFGMSNLNLEIWHHYAFLLKSGKIEGYCDGVKLATASTIYTTTQIKRIRLSESYNADSLNDFRIYDHYLSAKEVKEIAQALVLHYKFDDGSVESSTNLVTTDHGLSNTCYNGATNKYNYGTNTDMYKTVGMFQGRQCTKVYMSTNDLAAYPYVYFDAFSAAGTTTHTLSFDYFPTILDKIIPYSYNGNYNWNYSINGIKGNAVNASSITLTVNVGQWNHIEITAVKFDTTSTSRGIGYIRLGSASHTSNVNNYWLFANVQVEAKDHATPYMGTGGSRTAYIIDSSGYGNNGTVYSSPELSAETMRYSASTLFDGVEDAILIPYNAICPDNIFTCNLWFKKDTIGTKTYETLFGGPSGFEMDTRSNNASSLTLYMASVRGGSLTPLPFNEWTMVTMVRDGTNEFYYINGELKKTIEAKAMPTGNYFIGAWSSKTSQNYYGLISDFRLYNTPLSANDIQILYNTPIEIDKNGAWHTHQFTENGKNQITKKGLIENSASSEWVLTKYLKYDPYIYIEPDGSAWVHIYHHNNPAAGSFASGDTFTNSVYKDANRWFNATQICNQLNKWEFMIKYCYTTNGTIYKERWIQTKNPENAVFGDVDAADITRITGNDYKAGSWGGLYKKNASAYWVMNNGNSSNWWGATGSFSVYQGGIPGYGGTVTTSGYNDLYVRIDNGITIADATEAQINKNNIYIGDSLIEK